MPVRPYPKYRKHDWLDTKAIRPVYGIQIKPSKEDAWFNCHESGKALLFEDENLRDQKLSELRESRNK